MHNLFCLDLIEYTLLPLTSSVNQDIYPSKFQNDDFITVHPSRHKDNKKQKNNLVATIPHITNIDPFQDNQVKVN